VLHEKILFLSVSLDGFMRARLIDFLVLDLQPVVFGVGTAMFGEDLEMPRLKLVHVNPLQGDARRLRYQVLS